MTPTRDIPVPVLAAVLAAAVVLAPRTAGAWGRYHVKDLPTMVAEADAVVRGRMVREETDPDGEAMAVIRVERVLVGACPDEVRIPNTGPTGRPDCACEVGGVYYLCLSRSPRYTNASAKGVADFYYVPNDLLTKIPLIDGKVRRPPRLVIPEAAALLFPDNAAATWEAGLVWLGGPRVTVRPVQETGDFDEAVRLEVTLTNPASVAMGLPLSPERPAMAFSVRLFDAGGFPVLAEPWSGYDAECWGHAWYEPPVRTIEPGGSVTVRLAVRFHPGRFAQDPASARMLQVSYWAWACGEGRAWHGSAGGQTPIRLRCPDRAWAADLRSPNGQWAVTLEPDRDLDWGGLGQVDVFPGRGLPVRVYFQRRGEPPSHLPLGTGGGGRSSWGGKVAAPMERTLAACFRVTRDGLPLPRTEAEVRPLLKMLAEKAAEADRRGGRSPSWNGYALPKVDLARYFDLSAPGDYRVRFVLPGEGEPSRSEVLRAHVPEPTSGAD